MTVEEMTAVDQREVDRRVRRCRLRQWLGWAAYALVVVHLFYMIFGVFPMQAWMRPYGRGMTQLCVIALHFAVLFVLALVAKTGTTWIYGALQKECDPFLFEACVYHMGFMGNENLKRLNLAIAQYYQGNFQQAMDTIMHTDPSSFKKTNRLNYYALKSGLCFRFGMGDKVRELENEFQRRISGKQDTKNMQLLCAMNNLKRARANKDYESAWRFYQEWLHLSDPVSQQLWSKVGRAWQQAVLEQDCGNEAGARAAFAYVEKYGNRLMFVKDAARFLHPQETAADKTESEGVKRDGGTEA
ncbi:hypothetical protein H9X90_10035 [Faecalicatena contorta]|mgnify:FL=1|uniref:hypothetical protein n=1 Tax=Faecalicatena contorta TaxID=39482 RepID=UPI0019602E71|nr:hypothetical protein [Faecalicatena contorta]MBM6685314.1 hypothetical protein [Faecalicatena contorta]MBM6711073.1 hypothetical protein [Faecalicatena contorta]